MSALAELAHDAELIAGLGHNSPPASSPFDLIAEDAQGWLIEAGNFADGVAVESQAQADAVHRVIEGLRNSTKAADTARLDEVRPFDEAKKAIQEKYAPLFADPKTKRVGSVYRAIDALKACLKPFLDKREAERQEAARQAREEAEEAARKAAEAARAAQATDLAAQEAAEDLVAAAHQAEAEARRIENSRAQARGGERALGLRRVFAAVLTDRKAALLHYVAAQPEAFVELLQRLADQDVRAGKRQIPGFTVEQHTTL